MKEAMIELEGFFLPHKGYSPTLKISTFNHLYVEKVLIVGPSGSGKVNHWPVLKWDAYLNI